MSKSMLLENYARKITDIASENLGEEIVLFDTGGISLFSEFSILITGQTDRHLESLSQKTVVVAMSGGVDSSVAALLLHNEGFNVIGVTMRLFPQNEETNYSLNKSCCSLDDVEDARSVCRQIGAKHYYLNFEKEFNEHVVNYFISEYQKGRTPFPCLACNDRLKFDFLLKRAEFMKADYIATGHYASIIETKNEYKLIKGIDETKDQSYVLFNLTQNIMKKLKLPVGIFPKSEIRKIAEDHNLINAASGEILLLINDKSVDLLSKDGFTYKPLNPSEIDFNIQKPLWGSFNLSRNQMVKGNLFFKVNKTFEPQTFEWKESDRVIINFSQ